MKFKIFTLTILFMFSIGFSQNLADFSAGEAPLLNVCEHLKQVSLTFESESLKGTPYQGLKEFPPEVIDLINSKLAENPDFENLSKTINSITFSAEIRYNSSLCFAGSFMFEDSKLVFLKLEPDDLAGTSDEHILFFAEMSGLDSLFKEWTGAGSGEKGLFDMVGLYFKTMWRLLTSIIGNDVYVKPFSGVFKVFNGARAFMQIPDLSELQSELQSKLQEQMQ